MSAFDQHRVTVQRRHSVPTAYGTDIVDDGPPLENVPCTVRFQTSSEVTSEGLIIVTYGRLIARTWPGDEYSLVTFKGREYDTQGEPIEFDGSKATAHWEVSLKSIPKGLQQG